MSVYRPAVDVRGRGRGRTIAAVAAVFAVLAMHGLSCMAGGAHTAGIPVIGGASASHRANEASPHDCPGCRQHADVPIRDLDAALGVPPMVSTWAGGTVHRHPHRVGAARPACRRCRDNGSTCSPVQRRVAEVAPATTDRATTPVALAALRTPDLDRRLPARSS